MISSRLNPLVKELPLIPILPSSSTLLPPLKQESRFARLLKLFSTTSTQLRHRLRPMACLHALTSSPMGR